MKFIKQIALTLFLIGGIFCVVLYSTSCQKDACKGTTCLNNSSCSGGLCTCLPGTGGNNCETIYRNLYAGAYKGVVTTATYDTLQPVVDSACVGQTLSFNAPNDTLYNKTTIAWTDSTGKLIVNFPITLTTNTPNGSDFTITSVVSDTFTYNGTGNVNTVSASMSLKRSHPHGTSVTIFSFNSFSRH